MSMLNISGLQLKYLTAYNEYIADIIIAVIVYLSAFSMLIKTMLSKRIKHDHGNVNAEPIADDDDDETEKGGQK